MWVALRWYGLFARPSMHKLTLSVAAVMGMSVSQFHPELLSINTVEEITIFIMTVNQLMG